MSSKSKGALVNPQVKLKVIRKYDFKCIYCKTEGSNNNYLTVDHVFPKGHGGTNAQNNLACCCRDCNRKKKDMLLT